jgi:putative nucleotidyltransferase with HDIG domain
VLSHTKKRRIVVVGAIALLLMLGHWSLPTSPHVAHAAHVALQALLVLPVVLAAVWFGLRGAAATAALVTVLYSAHMLTAWRGDTGENLNQVAMLGVVWTVGVIAALLASREKSALQKAAAAREGALRAVMNALDAREANTGKHSLRVQAYAVRIGRELGMSEPELEALAEGALLHDVGKIGIADIILLKTGPLDKTERAKMQEHPEIGMRILAPVSLMHEAAEIVHAHHEKYDGTGYPRGLAGEEIPLGARVFAVADVYDALTGERPYRKPLTARDAAAAVEQMSGSHFDPRVVGAFRAVPVDEWNRLAQRVEEGDLADIPCESEATPVLSRTRAVSSDRGSGLS